MSLLDMVFSFIAPHACLRCGKEGELLCGWCRLDAFEPIPSRCYRCKRLTDDSATCLACRRHAPLRHVWVATQYSGIAKDLLHALKFERARAALRVLGDVCQETLPYLPRNTLVVPIPTATSRVRQRGYDQGVLLARYIADQTGLAYAQPLVRLTQSRQVGADRRQRVSQLERAFYLPRPKLVKNKNILLVDDVITTGSTLEVAARLLKRSGAKSVSALLFAQKQ